MLRRIAPLLFGLVWFANPAAADPKLQGVGTGSIGYTDNVQSSPDDPPPGVPEKTGDFFALLSPGLVLASSSGSAAHRLSYTYTLSLFLTESEANSSSNRLDYQLFMDPSPRYTLLFGASVLQANRHTGGLLSPTNTTAVSAAVPGTTSFVQVRGEQALSFEFARDWRLLEGAFGAVQTSITDDDAPRTYEAGGRLGVERLFIEDAVGVEGRADYTLVTNASLPDEDPGDGDGDLPIFIGDQRQLVTAAVARWRHDWGYDFASRLEAGAMRVQRLESGNGFWEPTGAAAVSYANEEGDAELAYQHTATTSPLLGQSYIIDEVRLRGGIPLVERSVVTLGTSLAYQHGRLIGETGKLETSLDIYLADVVLGWQWTDELLLDLRFQHAQQRSDAELPPLPLSYARNTVMVGAIFEYPPDTEMPRRYREPRRVDQADEIFDGRDPARARER